MKDLCTNFIGIKLSWAQEEVEFALSELNPHPALLPALTPILGPGNITIKKTDVIKKAIKKLVL